MELAQSRDAREINGLHNENVFKSNDTSICSGTRSILKSERAHSHGPSQYQESQETQILNQETRTRSGRAIRVPERFDHTAYSANYNVLHGEYFLIQGQMNDSIEFEASNNPETLYYHEAIAAPDRNDFLKAIVKEVNAHIENNHWALIPPKRDAPPDTKVLDFI